MTLKIIELGKEAIVINDWNLPVPQKGDWLHLEDRAHGFIADITWSVSFKYDVVKEVIVAIFITPLKP